MVCERGKLCPMNDFKMLVGPGESHPYVCTTCERIAVVTQHDVLPGKSIHDIDRSQTPSQSDNPDEK